jgi:malate dehydrogenase (oxaloacetate-decarboxylating)
VWRSSVPGDSTMPMIAAAADTIAALAHPTGTGAALLPVADLRTVSTAVAIAVAQAAVKHGLAAQPLTDPPFEPI